MLTHLIMAIAALAAAPTRSPAQTGPGTPEAFTQRMLGRLNREIPEARLTIGEPLQLRRTSGDSVINLDRVYNYCRLNSAEQCEALTATFIAAMRESIEQAEAPVRREQLRLMVRAEDYCAAVRGQLNTDGRPAGGLTRSIAPGLCAILVVDFPRTMRVAVDGNLTTLSLLPDEAWALALRQTLAGIEPVLDNGRFENGLMVLEGADYIPSLMLAHDAWRRAIARHGELVVAVPEDGAVLVMRRTDDLNALRHVVRNGFETGSRGISADLYRLTPNGWERLE